MAIGINSELGKIDEDDTIYKPISIIKFARKAMTRYGKYVIEDRALPDFRDGLKPVHRKLLWAMYDMGLHNKAKRQKAARVIGEVIGKWHPHGDKAAYDSLVTITNLPQKLADGEGNWGNPFTDDSAAHMRYPNTRLSKYSVDNFFGAEYIATSSMIPNYDDQYMEPLILPSLLPNLFVNGVSGIAVAITTSIPSYTVESVREIVTRLLNKEELEAKDYAKTLKFNFLFGGGELTSSSSELKNLYRNNSSSLEFKSLYKWDDKKRKMFFYSFAPNINVNNILNFLNQKDDEKKKRKRKPPEWLKWIKDAQDETSKEDGDCCSVTIRDSTPKSAIDIVRKNVEELFSSRVNYKINVTELMLDSDGKKDVKFHSTTIPQLFDMWIKWRIEMEVKALNYKLGVNLKETDYTKLLIKAHDNLEIVISALREDDSAQYISSKMGVSIEDANKILELKVRQLSKIDKNKMKDKLKTLKEENEVLSYYLKKPEKKIISDLSALKFESK